ncbi:hypothetical protein EV356DRAFT_370802 [Viridothelium virens]|uniref:Uncharacterized protein n=1 Tax=Viridothelium virens TaxID=1048519 RepID=A0A6A6GVW3_VIRVR|nr:hypothetical protein EV356DRAFT_370802 [Viridothelium virens]
MGANSDHSFALALCLPFPVNTIGSHLLCWFAISEHLWAHSESFGLSPQSEATLVINIHGCRPGSLFRLSVVLIISHEAHWQSYFMLVHQFRAPLSSLGVL